MSLAAGFLPALYPLMLNAAPFLTPVTTPQPPTIQMQPYSIPKLGEVDSRLSVIE